MSSSLDSTGGRGRSDRAAEEGQLDISGVAMDAEKPAAALDAVERRVPFDRLAHVGDGARRSARRAGARPRASSPAWPRYRPAPARRRSPLAICGLPPESRTGFVSARTASGAFPGALSCVARCPAGHSFTLSIQPAAVKPSSRSSEISLTFRSFYVLSRSCVVIRQPKPLSPPLPRSRCAPARMAGRPNDSAPSSLRSPPPAASMVRPPPSA